MKTVTLLLNVNKSSFFLLFLSYYSVNIFTKKCHLYFWIVFTNTALFHKIQKYKASIQIIKIPIISSQTHWIKQTYSFHRKQMGTFRKLKTNCRSVKGGISEICRFYKRWKVTVWNNNPLHQTVQENTFYTFQRQAIWELWHVRVF